MSPALPTREDLLGLRAGDSIRCGDMRAHRPLPVYPGMPTDVRISKRFRNGSVVHVLTDDMIRDMVADPWSTAEQVLDEMAAGVTR